MLTKPHYGWSEFQLEGTSIYSLSYLDDIAFEWLDQAIHGLEALTPFCVKGYMEPDRFLCTVSYWNCHIVRENDERAPLEEGDIVNEVSHTSMLQFCKYLYEDVSQNLGEWASFVDYGEDIDLTKKTEGLTQRLARLQELIHENEDCFDNKHCFL